MRTVRKLGLVCAVASVFACAGPTPPDPVTIPATATLIENVRFLDFSAGEDITDTANIVVDQGRILAVLSQDEPTLGAAAKVIDGSGLTALPGFYDMHVHVWDEAELPAYLAHGITTVRNMSGMPFHLRLGTDIEAGDIAGPRLLTTGPILNSPGPNAQINHQIVESADEARAAVRLQSDMGFTDLKVYSNLTRTAYEAIRDEAKALGMTLSGHTPEGRRDPGIPFSKRFNVSFEEILDDEFLTIEHTESIVWHGLYDQRDPDKARALARQIAQSGTPVTPTLVAHRNLVRVAETKGEYAKRAGFETMNPFTQQFEQAYIDQWAARDPAPHAIHGDFLGDMTRIMQEEGVLIIAGTDAGIFVNHPGTSLADELELMVAGGMSSYETLKTATWNPALALNESELRGRIAPGYVADLVLFDCDPLADISCIRSPAGVMIGGVWHDASGLKDLMDMARQTDADRTMSNVVAGLTAQGVDVSALLGP